MNINFCIVNEYDDTNSNFSVDFSSKEPFVKLTKESSLNDVAILVSSFLSFNSLKLNDEFVECLFLKNELALVGGLLFENDDILIGPSCCLDYQDWTEVIAEIRNSQSPWYGHDPDPWFEFYNSTVTLWSDEKGKSKIQSIKFVLDEFNSEFKKAKHDLFGFMEVVKSWSYLNYKANPEKLIDGISHYLIGEAKA